MRFILFSLLLLSCTPVKKMHSPSIQDFDWEAHRGGRGLYPENTIPAMINAIDLGVTTLEMDAVISKDHKVVVSHDPFFNEVITTTPGGEYLDKTEAQNRLLYQMNYDSIKKYDVGMKPHPEFPRQKKMRVYKPLLSELIEAAELYAREKNRMVHYNIEIKSVEGYDDIRHPAPGVFADLVIGVVKEKSILSRTIIQSFDVRALQYVHSKYPDVVLSYLVENTKASFAEQLQVLGFTPGVYSPDYKMVDQGLVNACHRKGIKMIPWTVNDTASMRKLISLGVDGLISDYPDLYASLK